nr:ribonuclease III [Corynebacterium sp. 76QC2CO]
MGWTGEIPVSRKHKLSPEQAWEEAFGAKDHAPLLEAFGVSLSAEGLRLALTHRSFGNEHGNLPNNERLEFLGDAVLGLSVAGQLFAQYPALPESHISKMRAAVVSRYGLAAVAREIGLGEHILLGKGELATGGSEKDSILADTTEAMLGAIYLEHGFEVARATVLRLFQTKINEASAEAIYQDWKTTLQERLAERKLPAPTYTAEASGPEHEKHFEVAAVVFGEEIGHGAGKNKKAAEQQAAKQAVARVQNEPSLVAQLKRLAEHA